MNSVFPSNPEIGVFFECELPILGRFVTWIATRFFFDEGLVSRRLGHNIEETGENERFIPLLYAYATGEKNE